MKKLIIGPILIMLLLSLVSCNTTTTESEVEKETPPMTVEEGKELTIESWEIGENWMYSQQSIWGDIMVGLETERQQGKVVKQNIATYNLRSREKELVYELPLGREVKQPPAIHENKIVWASVDKDEYFRHAISSRIEPTPNYDVFLLDLETNQVQQLTTEEHAQISPQIYGDTVVWLDARNQPLEQYPPPFDIYGYDLKTEKEMRITANTTAEGYNRPSISGNLVVWADNRHADPEIRTHPSNDPDYNNDIYLYDLTANEEKRITSYPGNDRHPDIDGGNIVWLRQEDRIKADVFVYNIQTVQETQVSQSNYADFPPSIYGNRVVWTDARVSLGNTSGDTVINGRQGQTDIYLFDLKTQQEIQLTSTEPGQVLSNPVIHDNFVVYEWSRMISPIVYAMNLDYK